MVKHSLKTVQPYYDQVCSGRKTFELRNNDRNFQAGDLIQLINYDPKTDTTGNCVFVKIVAVHNLKDLINSVIGIDLPGQLDNYVILSIKFATSEEILSEE